MTFTLQRAKFIRIEQVNSHDQEIFSYSSIMVIFYSEDGGLGVLFTLTIHIQSSPVQFTSQANSQLSLDLLVPFCL